MKPQTELTNETELEALILPLIIVENQSKWQVKTNFPSADFWLINKGNKDKLGEPVKEFEPYLTGIKCPDYIVPSYGYYLCLYFYQIGIWKQYALGTTNLNHLRIRDIKSFFNSLISTVQISE